VASDLDPIQAFGDTITDASERLAFADAIVGVEVEKWAQSTQGRYVIGRAAIEVREFIDWALSQDADPTEFVQRRAKALAARTLVTWLTEQILSGRTSEQQLQEHGQ
jgi:hypothetical protein